MRLRASHKLWTLNRNSGANSAWISENHSTFNRAPSIRYYTRTTRRESRQCPLCAVFKHFSIRCDDGNNPKKLYVFIWPNPQQSSAISNLPTKMNTYELWHLAIGAPAQSHSVFSLKRIHSAGLLSDLFPRLTLDGLLNAINFNLNSCVRIPNECLANSLLCGSDLRQIWTRNRR